MEKRTNGKCSKCTTEIIKMGRLAYAVELKTIYFNIMVRNIKDTLKSIKGLFDE